MSVARDRRPKPPLPEAATFPTQARRGRRTQPDRQQHRCDTSQTALETRGEQSVLERNDGGSIALKQTLSPPVDHRWVASQKRSELWCDSLNHWIDRKHISRCRLDYVSREEVENEEFSTVIERSLGELFVARLNIGPRCLEIPLT